MQILVTWIGNTDLMAAAKDDPDRDPGPILRLLQRRRFERIHFLNDLPEKSAAEKRSPREFQNWLTRVVAVRREQMERHDGEPLRNDYDGAYAFTREVLHQVRDRYAADTRFTLLLSPGLPAAQVAMIVAALTIFRRDQVELVNTSRERDCETVQLPFLVSIDVVDGVLNRWQVQPNERPIHSSFEAILGESKKLRQAIMQTNLVASLRKVNVVLRGETGTGKEMFASCLHKASPRSQHPFVPLNCTAIAATLLEATLFGAVKGAYTGSVEPQTGLVEKADKGTLFLDEIGDMPLELQAKLLRFVQEGTYYAVGDPNERRTDVRIVAATHQPLEEAVRTGRFREDLYYRLSEFSVHLPPLRERGDDLHRLAERALDRFYAENMPEGERKRWSPQALRSLQRYPWPGNVRELQNRVIQLAILSPGPEITAAHVQTILGPAPWRPDACLCELDGAAFLDHLTAVLDELLARFRVPGKLPRDYDAESDLLDEILEPLVWGRAFKANEGNGSKAGRMFRKSKLDKSKPEDQRRLERYEEHLGPVLNEQRIAQLQGSQP